MGVRTVCQLGGDGQDAPLVHAHAFYALVPALDDLADTHYADDSLDDMKVRAAKCKLTCEWERGATVTTSGSQFSAPCMTIVYTHLESNLLPFESRVPVYTADKRSPRYSARIRPT